MKKSAEVHRYPLDGPSADALDETANDPQRVLRMGKAIARLRANRHTYATQPASWSSLPLNVVVMPIWQAAC